MFCFGNENVFEHLHPACSHRAPCVWGLRAQLSPALDQVFLLQPDLGMGCGDRRDSGDRVEDWGAMGQGKEMGTAEPHRLGKGQES